MKHINENHQLDIVEKFIEKVGELLCQKREREAYDIHLHIDEIYQQTLAFLYRSIFILLCDDIRFSEYEHIWKELTQRMDTLTLSVDNYLWKESTCSFFAELTICNDDIFLVLSNLEKYEIIKPTF